MISTFQLFYYLQQRYGLTMHWQVLWCSFSSIGHDGNNGYELAIDALDRYLIMQVELLK
jgi:hypothetical protein